MNKPKGYDEINVDGNFEPITIGAHIAVIKMVEEIEEDKHIKVMIDFAPDDAQAGYFKKKFDSTEDKGEWPFQACKDLYTFNQDGTPNKQMKAFHTAFLDSNGCKELVWGKDYAKQFKGKKIGVMYGEVEANDGRLWPRIRWFFDINKKDKQTIPMPKLQNKTNAAASSTDWMNIPETDQEALPFT